jgi:Fe-S cluster assembly protein SufD
MNIAVNHYRNEFDQVKKKLAGNTLPWLRQLRQSALEQFTQQGFPTLQDEDWKYTNLTPLTKRLFKLAPLPINGTVAHTNLSEFIIPELECHRLVFIDGHFIAQFSPLNDLPNGATITNLAQALTTPPTALHNHLGQYADNASTGITPLNTALFQDGAYIHLAANTVVAKPIELIFIATAQTESYCTALRNLIVAEKNSRAQIIETYVSLDTNNHFTNAITELVISEDAAIQHYKLLQENTQAFHISALQVEQAARSHFTSHSFALGGALVRSDIHTHLAAEHAECILNGLYVLNDQQHIDHHTLIDHAQPKGTSREYYKGVIGDRARAVFNGKVRVRADAQKTDAQQSNKNLLLSDTAEIDTKPQLEIYADDVQCAHGATVGQLDDNALFYLRARGIDTSNARAMLIHAFARDMLDRIPIVPLRAHLEKQLNTKL